MEFGKHIGKGLWGLADKALPVAYGVAYVVLVIRVLPEVEFGNFVLVQELFLVVSGLATAFALQPLLKYASEERADIGSVVSISLALNLAFVLVCSLILVIVNAPMSMLLNSPGLASLVPYLPAMLGASFVRNFTLVLLQTKFRIKEVFWTDAAHFLGAPLLIEIASRMHMFNAALDLVIINLVSLSASSVVGLYLSRRMIRLTLKPHPEEMRRMWRYGNYSFGVTVSYLVYTKADTFILAAATGPIQVAVYNSVKVFVRVYEMVTQVIQMFVLPAASKLSSLGEKTSLKIMLEKATLFSTVGMMPVLIAFLAIPSLIITTLYGGRYLEAVPVLQIFSLLSIAVPLTAVEANALMGLGEARASFILGLQTLIVSLLAYFALIPWLGTIGAATGYVVAAFISAWLTMRVMDRFVPLSLREVLGRTDDILGFLRSRLPKRETPT